MVAPNYAKKRNKLVKVIGVLYRATSEARKGVARL